MKRQKNTEGSIVKIDLGNGYHSYARILTNSNYAFYDLLTNKNITDLNEIISKPIIFILSVYNDAVSKGRWLKIGTLPLENKLLILPKKYIQDALNPGKFEIYDPNTGKSWSATKEECSGLERAAVWEAEEVEERLRDYFAGRPNKLRQEDLRIFK